MQALQAKILGVIVLAAVLFGCGGGGDKGTTGGGSSGVSSDVALKSQINGAGAILATELTASSTPQTVTVIIDGFSRTIPNVIVPFDIDAPPFGMDVTILKQGSQLLNMDIPNPGAGISFNNSTVRAPISSSGVLQATIIAKSGNIVCRTPPGTWQGYSLPNGLLVHLWADDAHKDVSAGVDATIRVPKGTDTQSGTLPVTYESPTTNGEIQMAFRNGITGIQVNTDLLGQVNAPAAQPGTAIVPWAATKVVSAGDPTITEAIIDVWFHN